MRKTFAFLLFAATIFSSCHLNGKGDKYEIQGTVKNHPAKSVMLEKLGLQQITVVDSSKIDDKGNFSMTGVSETGFYRIKLDDKTFWLILLEPDKYKINIDLSNQEDAFKIEGPIADDEFQKAMKSLNEVQKEVQTARYAYLMGQQMQIPQDSLAIAATQLQAAAGKLEKMCLEGAKNAKNPLVALFYITNTPLQNYSKENLAVIERMEKEIPNSSYTKEFRTIYNQFEAQAKAGQQGEDAGGAVEIGKPAPEIDLKTPDGNSIKLSSLKGKVVLLDFWASWCGPCRMEMPNVVAAYKKYKDKGFTIYSVSLDKDMNAWKNSIKQLGMTWENQVSDLKFWQCEAAVRYGVNGIPAAFLINRDGVIVASNLRGQALDQKLAELLP